MNRNCCRQPQISQRPSHAPNTLRRPERVEVHGLQRHTVCQKFARTLPEIWKDFETATALRFVREWAFR
jgi:hypothetical protein